MPRGHRKKVFITGGAGFIGSRLAAALSDQADVTVYDNLLAQSHKGNPENLSRLTPGNIAFVKGDIRDATSLDRAIATSMPDIVYHLAAETGTAQSYDEPAHYSDVNVMGTTYLIDAMRRIGGVERVVLASSRSVYGEGAYSDADGQPARAAPRCETDLARGDYAVKSAGGTRLSPRPTQATCPVAPASIYASTKLMQEYLLQQAFWGSGTRVGILRLQNVYGPGQSLHNPYTGVLSHFCRQIAMNQRPEIFEDGHITRDFVWVEDVVDAFIRMGAADVMPEDILDIGSGRPTTILQVAQTLLRLQGRDATALDITGAYRPGDVRYACADIGKATQDLNWTPKQPLLKGLYALTAWSQKRNRAQAA